MRAGDARPDMTPLRVAGIGLGDLGRTELHVLADIDGVEVVAGADVSERARDRFAADFDAPTYEDHESLLDAEGVDLVNVVTPHAFHYEQARAALDRGVHVHLEKPMVTDVEHAEDLIARADGANLVLAIGYQRHVDDRFREIRRLLDEGRIGTPHMATCHLEQVWIEWAVRQWRGKPDLSGGGQLYDSGSHLLDALLWTTRTDPVSVAASIDDRGEAVDVNSALAVTLDRDGDRITGSVGVTGAGQSTPAPGERLDVWGTEGHLSFDGEAITVTEAGTTYRATPDEPDFERLTRRKLGNVVDAIRDGADLQTPAADALRVTALTEAAYRSDETGERVAVRELLSDGFGA
jgi:predicted dehydrogenase